LPSKCEALSSNSSAPPLGCSAGVLSSLVAVHRQSSNRIPEVGDEAGVHLTQCLLGGCL
jgi:hypothetical protein